MSHNFSCIKFIYSILNPIRAKDQSFANLVDKETCIFEHRDFIIFCKSTFEIRRSPCNLVIPKWYLTKVPLTKVCFTEITLKICQ